MIQTIKASMLIRIHATTDTPDIGATWLLISGRGTSGQVCAPSEGRIHGARRRRPIEVSTIRLLHALRFFYWRYWREKGVLDI